LNFGDTRTLALPVE